MRISFIIATWNCLTQIKECIRTIEELKIPDSEIIVVDAASKDGTAEYLAGHQGITTRLMPKKLSWSENNNIGIEISKGDWLAVINPDIYFNQSFGDILDVLDLFKQPPYPIVSPQLVFPDGRPQTDVLLLDFWSMAKHFTLIGAYLNGIIKQHKIGSVVWEPVYQPNQIMMRGGHKIVKMIRSHGRGSFFIIHRSNIERFGGQLWRPEIRLIAADSDMFRMASEKGVDILSVPSARIIHEEGHATKYQDQTDLYKELGYGLVMFARYWSEHPRIFSALLIADVIFTFLIAPVKRKLFKISANHPRYTPKQFLKSYRFRMVGKIEGLIEAWNTPMSKPRNV